MSRERCAYCWGRPCSARGVRLVGGAWWCADHQAHGRRMLRAQLTGAALGVAFVAGVAMGLACSEDKP